VDDRPRAARSTRPSAWNLLAGGLGVIAVARNQHRSLRGVVVLRLVIGTDGRACAVRVVRGMPMGLDREVVAAVHRWRYRPARAGDRAVPVYFQVQFRFEL
jgi:periplasmic protein TonB